MTIMTIISFSSLHCPIMFLISMISMILINTTRMISMTTCLARVLIIMIKLILMDTISMIIMMMTCLARVISAMLSQHHDQHDIKTISIISMI